MERGRRGPVMARVGWVVIVGLAMAFAWGLHRRARLEASGEGVIRMLFVPSVEQGTLVRRGEELARFVRADSGLVVRSEVPTSYAAVIQALGTGQADVAWVPAFAYVLAHARYGAEARLQVVRAYDLDAVVVVRTGRGEPVSLADLAGHGVALPGDLPGGLAEEVRAWLDREAPGWVAVKVADDVAAVRLLLDEPGRVAAAVSSHVFSGPNDLVGDGRKRLESERPGTMAATRVLATTGRRVARRTTTYNGCILARTDSGIRGLADLEGRTFAFSDETSTSGHIFARALLDRAGVRLGRTFFAGGHPNVVQAVADGKVAAGAVFYSPPGERERRERTFVGDARKLILKRFATDSERLRFLAEVRIVALTDPIPNDVCCVRKGFPRGTWERFARSLQRFLDTEAGRSAYFDLVAGVAAAPCDDTAFDGFRDALRRSGVSAGRLLEAEEAKLRRRGGGG